MKIYAIRIGDRPLVREYRQVVGVIISNKVTINDLLELLFSEHASIDYPVSIWEFIENQLSLSELEEVYADEDRLLFISDYLDLLSSEIADIIKHNIDSTSSVDEYFYDGYIGGTLFVKDQGEKYAHSPRRADYGEALYTYAQT